MIFKLFFFFLIYKLQKLLWTIVTSPVTVTGSMLPVALNDSVNSLFCKIQYIGAIATYFKYVFIINTGGPVTHYMSCFTCMMVTTCALPVAFNLVLVWVLSQRKSLRYNEKEKHLKVGKAERKWSKTFFLMRLECIACVVALLHFYLLFSPFVWFQHQNHLILV